MVFFSCDGCAEMLKKSQVDNHANRCRCCVSVSCVDCNVTFFGDDYRSHTSCLTEAERYEGKKRASKVKLSPQDAWMDLVSQSVSNAPTHLRRHLTVIVSLSNLPRKEKPFRNFVANSIRGLTSSETAELWEFLQSLRNTKKLNTGNHGVCEDTSTTKAPTENHSTTKNDSRDKIASSQATIIAPDGMVPPGDSSSKKVNEKSVKKTMKKLLRKRTSMSEKELIRSVRLKCGLLSKSEVKRIIKASLEGSKKFRREGETVYLNP